MYGPEGLTLQSVPIIKSAPTSHSTTHSVSECCSYHIEDGRERASNVVEGHSQVLEGEVVEGYHTHEYDRQR